MRALCIGTVLWFCLCFPFPALASLEDNLTVYGSQSAALLVVKPQEDIGLEALSLLPAPQAKMLLEHFETLSQRLTPDSKRALQSLKSNLGNHLSLAYQPETQGPGHLLFNLDLKTRTQTLQSKISSPQHTQFAKQTIYDWPLKTAPNQPALILSMVWIDQQVLGCLGTSNEPLKNMIYRHQFKQDTASSLSNTETFKPVYQALKQEPLWLYFDAYALLKQLFQQSEFQNFQLKQQYWLNDMAYYYRGFGLGLNRQKNRLHFSHYAAHDLNQLSIFQNTYLNHQSHPPQNIQPLLNTLPAPPIVLATAQNFDLNLIHPWPSQHPLPFTFELPSFQNNTQWVQTFMNLELETEIIPYLDGRAVFALMPSETDRHDASILILGLKSPHEYSFERILSYRVKNQGNTPEIVVRIDGTAIYRQRLNTPENLAEVYFAIAPKQMLISDSLDALKSMLKPSPTSQKQNAQALISQQHASLSADLNALKKYLKQDSSPLPETFRTEVLNLLSELPEPQNIHLELFVNWQGQNAQLELDKAPNKQQMSEWQRALQQLFIPAQ